MWNNNPGCWTPGSGQLLDLSIFGSARWLSPLNPVSNKFSGLLLMFWAVGESEAPQGPSLAQVPGTGPSPLPVEFQVLGLPAPGQFIFLTYWSKDECRDCLTEKLSKSSFLFANCAACRARFGPICGNAFNFTSLYETLSAQDHRLPDHNN